METCYINPKEQSIEMTTTRIRVKRKKETVEKQNHLWLYFLHNESGTALEEQQW